MLPAMKHNPHVPVCVCLLLLAAGGCGRAASPPPMAPAPEDEFQKLLATSLDELQQKSHAAHKAWGLGSFDRWNIDQQVGDLVFSQADGTTVTAKAQIIGSFSTKDNSWLWAWDNPSILDPLKRDALQVKAYGEKHRLEKLTTRKWIGTEDDAWAMTALAVKLCGAHGAYRGPAGDAYVFMTFGEVNVSKPPQAE